MTEVSERELIRRIDQALLKAAWPVQELKVGSGSQLEHFGKYYLYNKSKGTVDKRHVDLEEQGRELGVLSPLERLVG